MGPRTCQKCGAEKVAVGGGRTACRACTRKYKREQARKRRLLAKSETGTTCRKCGVLITQDNVSTVRYVCLSCCSAYTKTQYRKHHNVIIKRKRASDQREREDCFAAYGGRCVCCGESYIRFLEIDHIRGDGADHRRKLNRKGGIDTYRWLRHNGYPKDNFQLLCSNCNHAKGYYGVCPHTELSLVELVKSGKKLEFSATGTPIMVEAA